MIKEPSPCCPNCGCEITDLLANLEEKEREYKAQTYREPEKPLIDELKPPLGPAPFPPYFSSTGVFLVLVFVVQMAGVENWILHFLLVLFSTMGIYYGILKPRHDFKLEIWRKQTEGAYVCRRCYSLFK